jgi:hypothetical protein
MVLISDEVTVLGVDELRGPGEAWAGAGVRGNLKLGPVGGVGPCELGYEACARREGVIMWTEGDSLPAELAVGVWD